MTSTSPDTPTGDHTPHLTMAHQHLALLVATARRSNESPHQLDFRIDDVPDLLFVLANLMLSYLEDETGDRSAGFTMPPWFVPPGATTGHVMLDGNDPTVQALVKLLETLKGRQSAEPTPDAAGDPDGEVRLGNYADTYGDPISPPPDAAGD